MRVSIIGSGYVGLVTAACLAEVGNKILCCDIDSSKIEQLKNGQSPIYEPGLDELLERNIREQRLNFTTRIEDAVNHAELIFICVGTPPREDGSADLRHVVKVAQQIATYMNGFKVIINKSTVPVGTGERVADEVRRVLVQRNNLHAFTVVSNPEFLKEGAAIDDFLRPDRIVLGTDYPVGDRKPAEFIAPETVPLCLPPISMATAHATGAVTSIVASPKDKSTTAKVSF